MKEVLGEGEGTIANLNQLEQSSKRLKAFSNPITATLKNNMKLLTFLGGSAMESGCGISVKHRRAVPPHIARDVDPPSWRADRTDRGVGK